jgi:hypothetical protein
MAKAITSIGTYSNAYSTIRQRLSRMMGDCVLATCSAGSTTTATLSSTDPAQFYEKPDDFFNEQWWEFYTYAGTNIGYTNVAKDWVKTTHVLTGAITMASSYGVTSKLELHNIFYVSELRDAINQAINFYANKYLLDLKDETTIHLTRTERNDVSDSYIYTYEYALPTDCLWLWRVTTEDCVSGVKITGTLSDDFTLGETVNGSSSGASGLVSYTDATTGYIRVREEDGTFTTSDTVTGVTSEETVTSISDIDRTEVAGDGKFPPENVLDHRDWGILKPYAPKLRLIEGYYSIVEDLRLRLEYQGIQDDVTADTDTIMLPPDELIEVAATFLPFSKIESNNLTAKFNQCLETRAKVEARPKMHPYANARKCW